MKDYGYKKRAMPKGKKLGRFQDGGLARLQEGIPGRAKRTQSFFELSQDNKSRSLGATLRVGQRRSKRRDLAFNAAREKPLQRLAKPPKWPGDSIAQKNPGSGATIRTNPENSRVLQAGKVSIHAPTYNSYNANQSYGGKNNDSGKFLIFRLPDLQQNVSFRLRLRSSVLAHPDPLQAGSTEKYAQRLPQYHFAAFRRSTRLLDGLWRAIRAAVNRLNKKFFSIFDFLLTNSTPLYDNKIMEMDTATQSNTFQSKPIIHGPGESIRKDDCTVAVSITRTALFSKGEYHGKATINTKAATE